MAASEDADTTQHEIAFNGFTNATKSAPAANGTTLMAVDASNGWVYTSVQDGKVAVYKSALPTTELEQMPHTTVDVSGSLASSVTLQSSMPIKITTLCVCPFDILETPNPNKSNKSLTCIIVGNDAGEVWMYKPTVSESSFIHSHLISTKMGTPLQIACCKATRIIFALYDSGQLAVWKYKTFFSQYFPRITGSVSLSLHPEKQLIAMATRDREIFILPYPKAVSETASAKDSKPSEIQPIYQKELFKKLSNTAATLALSTDWHPKEAILLLPGDTRIRTLHLDTFQIHSFDTDFHRQDIYWIASTIVDHQVLVVSIGFDRSMGVWDFGAGCLLCAVNCPFRISNLLLEGSLSSLVLSFSYNEGQIGRTVMSGASLREWLSEKQPQEATADTMPLSKQEDRPSMIPQPSERPVSIKKAFIDDTAGEERSDVTEAASITEAEPSVTSDLDTEQQNETEEEGDNDEKQSEDSGIFDDEEDETLGEALHGSIKADSAGLYPPSADVRYRERPIYRRLRALQIKVHRLQSLTMHSIEQPIITPGKFNVLPVDGTKPWCLFWTKDGHISKRSDENGSTIEIYEKDSEPKRRRDVYGSTAAALSASGYALGSPSPPDSVAPSIIEFYAFTETNGAAVSIWEKRLPTAEDVECLAVGLEFVAVLTSSRYLRIYSISGMLQSITRVKGLPVSIVANFNLLFVVTKPNLQYSKTFASKSDNVYYYEFLKINSLKFSDGTVQVLDNGEFTLEAEYLIKWTSISDIGMPAFMDTHGQIYGLLPLWRTQSQPSLQWTPLCNLIEATSNGDYTYWPISIEQQNQEFDMIQVIRLEGGKAYPSCTQSAPYFGYSLERLPMRLPECNISTFDKWKAALQKDPQYVRSEEALHLPWEQFAELRYRLELKNRQLRIAEEFGYALDIVNPFRTIAEHESVIIRLFTKVIDDWKLTDLAVETAALMKLPQTFQKALEKCLDPKNYNHKRVLREMRSLQSRFKKSEEEEEEEEKTPSSNDENAATPRPQTLLKGKRITNTPLESNDHNPLTTFTQPASTQRSLSQRKALVTSKPSNKNGYASYNALSHGFIEADDTASAPIANHSLDAIFIPNSEASKRRKIDTLL